MSVGILWIGLLFLLALSGATYVLLSRESHCSAQERQTLTCIASQIVYLAFGITAYLIGEIAPSVSLLPSAPLLKYLAIVQVSIGIVQIAIRLVRRLQLK